MAVTKNSDRGDAENRPLVERIRAERIRHGWSVRDLADRAGVSPTTLYNLDGHTGRPQTKTLKSIASALELTVEELLTPLGSSGPGLARTRPEAANRFDKATNQAVSSVMDERPQLFSGWSDDELDELYSMFGTGGQLTPRGVVSAAEAINRRRETVQKLHVVLDTHLREEAIHFVDMLYRLTQTAVPASPAASMRQLAAGSPRETADDEEITGDQ